MINDLRNRMKTEYGVDLISKKDFGPRTPDSFVKPGSHKILPGVDFHFSDQLLLRYLTARNFNVKQAAEHLLYQLEWRQTNVPIPMLTDKTLKLMSMGLIYLHGRCMDGTPLMYIDMVRV